MNDLEHDAGENGRFSEHEHLAQHICSQKFAQMGWEHIISHESDHGGWDNLVGSEALQGTE